MIRLRPALALLLASLALLGPSLAGPAAAEPLAKTLFGAVPGPVGGKPMAYGEYARGCATGLVQLPESGPTWQAMRLSRNRNWGQPEMIDYLVGLSQAAQKIGWAGLYIGDISQPRGGPMNGGHASHQTGLDADIWFLPAKRLTLSRAERESVSSISLRTADQTRVNGNWTAAHRALLKAAASDPRVDRIFVAAAIKVEMCKTATRRDKAWLQKIRPFYGHEDHFHVRLKCPKGEPYCKTQTPTVGELSKGGDGCDATLDWWVTTYLEELRNPPKRTAPAGPVPKRPSQFTLADLPGQCADVLASD